VEKPDLMRQPQTICIDAQLLSDVLLQKSDGQIKRGLKK